MLFNSLAFFVFLAVVVALARLLPHKAQNRWLLLASYFFYGAWDWRFLGLILLSTVIDYAVGRALGRTDDERRRRRLVTVSIVANLGLLGTFKYAGFFMGSLERLLTGLGIELPPLTFEVVLPVGISFYTFQTLSYTIDVYRRRLEPTDDFLDFALFVAFFPQLVAGPIERAVNLLPQIQAPRRVRWEQVGSGGWLILWGLFKKAVIADHCWPVVHGVFATTSTPTGPEILFGCYAFGLFLYCDFSGYSDIARGVARLMGFELMVNFALPYLTTSLRDFWRRWHVSLSSWLRDYLYIPLGGNRHDRLRNLWITMVLCGLWHGAGWNFFFFGVYHGTLLCLYHWSAAWRERWLHFEHPVARGAWTLASVLLTFHVVVLSWSLFEIQSPAHWLDVWGRLFTNFDPGLAPRWLGPLLVTAAPLFVMEAVQARTGDLEPWLRAPLWLRTGLALFLFLDLVLLGEDFGEEFFYFQF